MLVAVPVLVLVMAFWICAADANGNRIVGAEEQLSPGPAEVEYPTDPAGVLVETGDGKVVKQQPMHDARRRVWLWHHLPNYLPRYPRLIARLEGLVSRTRVQQGLSPYVYVKEDATYGLRVWDYQSGAASSATANTLTDSTKNWTPNRYTNGAVEIKSGTGAGQRRAVIGNTATQLTLDSNWTTTPDTTSQYVMQATVTDWVRVRVLEVSKRPSGKSGMTWDPVRVAFVVDDSNWNDQG